jgi:hypothetical protein
MSNPVPLPAGTTVGKSFEYGIDLNLASYAVPSWQPIRRMSGYQPADTETTQDAQTYDDLGSPNSDITARGFGHSFNVQVNRSLATGLYLPEVEALLARVKPLAVGELAVIDYRWYHKPAVGAPNPNDAGRGFATVAKTRQNTGPNGEIEVLGFTLTGKGSYEEIPNPFLGWGTTAPIIGSVTEGKGDGELVTVTGSGLLTATSVTVDGAPVEFLPVNGATLVFQQPVGDAGQVDLIITSPAGASAVFTYTRGA